MANKKTLKDTPPSGFLAGHPQVPGFQAAGIHAGIKSNGKRDLALIVSDPPARVSGVFTQNRVKAAPVLLSQARIRSGLCRAVIVNSGNANACTGDQGMQDAIEICQKTAKGLDTDEGSILISSTGLIGERLPCRRIYSALPRIIKRINPEGIPEAAEAIQTTDRFTKLLWSQASIDGKRVTLCGFAKGAGMIRPNMATMLAYFLTDLKAPVTALRRLLKEGVKRSFNRISVDGDASTNDTVLLLANGLAQNSSAGFGSSEYNRFADLLFPMMLELATLIVKDGEGATKVVTLRIEGAQSETEASRIAYHIASSSLVKTSFYGEDPNWGRLMVALGTVAPATLSPERIDISYDDCPVVRKGVGIKNKKKSTMLKKVLKKEAFCVTINLNMGRSAFSMLTSDLSHDYVSLNSAYPT